MRRFIVFLVASLVAPAQSTLPQGDGVFRTTTQLVQIDVAAQDKNGKPVADLTRDDFELFVNGKRQPIDTFTVTTPVPPAPPVALARGTFSNKQAAAEVSQGRYTVFLLDWRNTNWQLQSWAHQQLLKMLSETPPANKVALYLIDNGFQIVQEFTLDHELLKAKVAGLWGEVQAPVATLDQAEQDTRETVTAFQDIAKHLAGISGQKLLIWVSTGFPDRTPHVPPPPGTPPVEIRPNNGPSDAASFSIDIDNAVRILGNANIVVESAESTYLFAHVSPDTGPTATYPGPLREIAERTGGRYFPGDNNDLASTLSAAANDRAASYELGYYAGDNLQPGLQPFEIRCRRAGVTLRYREGYYVAKKPPTTPAGPLAAAHDVLERAVDAVSVPLTATVTRTMGNIPGIVLRLKIDPGGVTLRQDGSVWRGKVSVLTRFASDVGDQLGDVPLDGPSLNLTDAQHERSLRDGITMRFSIGKLPSEAATLRVLVRDEDSGNMGSVTIPLGDLPEL